MVPSSVRQRVYWAAPGPVRRSRSLERACWRASWAPSPPTSTLPRWERSNTPTDSRTALCSDRVPWYSIGMSQPAKAPILAPRRRWTASRGERRSPVVPAVTGGPRAGGPGDSCRVPGGSGRPRRAAWGAGGPDRRRRLVAHHPLGAAGLEPGVVGPHALGVADDLHVVDGQLELLGPPPERLGGADPAAGPLAVGGHRDRGGVGDHGLGLDEELHPDPGVGELAQGVQVLGGRLPVHGGDLPAAATADAEVVEEAQLGLPVAVSTGWTMDRTWRDTSRWGSSVASAISRTLQRTTSRMEMMPTILSSEITGRWRTLAWVIWLAASSIGASGVMV